MQFLNTPQFVVKAFKRHYRKVKEVADILVRSEKSLTFQYMYENGTLQTKLETPNDDATVHLVVLMRRFLDPASILFYQSVWDTLKEHFPDAIPPELASQLEEFMHKVNKGWVPFVVNEEEVTAENMYHIVANGEYFGNTDEEAVAFLKNVGNMPTGPWMLHQFYSYNFDFCNVASMLFSIILEIEHSDRYRHLFQEEISTDKRCIYCLNDTGIFTSEEHIVPESLGNYDHVLPKGVVCDSCNNEILARLDEELVTSDMLGLLKTLFMPYTKDGKLPQATFQNLTIKKTHPTHIVINTSSKKYFTMDETDEYGVVHFTIKTAGRKKFDPKTIGRSLYKIGLGMVAFHQGREVACDIRYDAARSFILRGDDFPNKLLISNQVKPHPHITSHYDDRWGGTCFQIDIYGIIFIFNLETSPILEPANEKLEEMNFSSFPLNSGE